MLGGKVPLIAVFIFMSIRPVFAASVLSIGSSRAIIAVSQDATRPWQVQDKVCIYQNEKEVVCGIVLKTNEQAGFIKLDAPDRRVMKGQIVRLRTLAQAPVSNPAVIPQRKPSAVLLQSVPKAHEASNFYHNLSGGFSVGSGFYYPLLHFQRSISPSLAIGIMPSYFSVSTGTGSISSFAFMATGNYYGHDFFRGLWIQGGLGASFLSSQATAGEQQATSLLSLLTVGWRGYWDLGFNIGVCAGIQYLGDPGFTSVRLSGSGVQPLALIDVGVNF